MKIAVVTGANRGIGLASTLFLAKNGYSVVMACRNESKALQSIRDHIHPQISLANGQIIECMPLDLSSFESVHKFVSGFGGRYGRAMPDILVNNAGVLLKDFRASSLDGHELTLQTNYLSPALLSLLFLKSTSDSGMNRLVHISAAVHRMIPETDFSCLNAKSADKYDGWKTYCNTKRYLLMFSNLLTRSLRQPVDSSLSFLQKTVSNDFKSVSLDPGWVKTGLVRPDHGWNAQDIEKKTGGASTNYDSLIQSLQFAIQHDSVKSGDFIMRGRVSKTGKGIDSVEDQNRLWTVTRDLIKF